MEYEYDPYHVEIDIFDVRVSIKETCCGVCISSISENDARLKITPLVEDDEMWFDSKHSISSSWIPEIRRCINMAQYWLNDNTYPHIENSIINDDYRKCAHESTIRRVVDTIKEGCVGVALSLRSDIENHHIVYTILYYDHIASKQWYVAERGYPAKWNETLINVFNKVELWMQTHCEPDGDFGYTLKETSPFMSTFRYGEVAESG